MVFLNIRAVSVLCVAALGAALGSLPIAEGQSSNPSRPGTASKAPPPKAKAPTQPPAKAPPRPPQHPPQHPPVYPPPRPPGGSPIFVNNTIINHVKINVNYINTVSGLVITNNSQVQLTNTCLLDPGDVIVSVGSISCNNTAMTLDQMIAAAYQSGNLIVVIRDVNTGNLVEIELPPGDDQNGVG